MSRKLIALITLIFGLSSLIYAGEYDYGLKIKTYPSPGSEFTGLILEGNKELDTKGEPFEMSFQLYNRNENVFGTLFRIITDKGDNIDLMYSVSEEDTHYPMLVTGEYVHDIDAPIVMNEWIPVSITLNPKSGEIEVNYNGSVLQVKDAGTKGARSFRIAFGHSPIQGYVLDDVASINIRDIIISVRGKVIRHWDLSIHDNDICFDNIKNSPAKAINPVWIVDQYISWNKIHTCNFSSSPSVAFDPEGIFYMSSDGKSISSYNAVTNTAKTINTKGGAFTANAPNQMMFIGDAIISYNLNEHTHSYFDNETGKWIGGSDPVKDHDYYNNAACWWESEGAIVSFGGYGHYRYNNKLLIQYDDHEKDFEAKIEEITPRYGCAATIVGDTLYVFGGRGNLSGKQELSPKYYYDLYAINLRTKETKKLWSIDKVNQEFVLGEQMIYDKSEDCFYAISTIQNGTLIKFNKTEATYEEVSLPVGFSFGGQYLTYSLFRNKEQTKLYAILIRSEVNGESTVQIADMNWPPVTMQLLHLSVVSPERHSESNNSWIWILSLIFVAFGGIGGTILYYERRLRGKKVETSVDFSQETHYYDFSKNSICFFGGFNVKDRNGNDITAQFTPNLKALTILLLLHSSEDSAGISSGKLNRTLWSYKPEEAANNNRNVYISKLRSIFESMDGFTIVNKNKLWEISMTEDAKSDWIYAKSLFNAQENEENISRIVELLLRGAMLPNTEIDWLDVYKGEFSNLTIDLLCKLLERDDVPNALKIKVANTIFMHDFLNEDALKAKCQILYKEGKTGLAKTTYDNFCKEYKSSIGIDFEIDFKKLIAE